MLRKRTNGETKAKGPATPPSKTRQRGSRRIAPLEDRAFYTRAETIARYGFSDKRLAELTANDPTLPVIWNGRYQIFPKLAFDEWFRVAASRQVNIHQVG
jgi:hypothetical protein